MKKDQRKLKNLWLDSSMQSRVGLQIVVVNFAIGGVGVYILIHLISKLKGALELLPAMTPGALDALISALFAIVATAVVTTVVAAIVNYLAGVYLTHRFAGPARVIVEALDNIKNGQPIERHELRPNDELKPIMNKVLELEEHLKKQSK